MSFVHRGTLGSLTRGGLTIDYYPAGGLKFSDKNLRKLHDGIVDLDFKWQAALTKITGSAGALAPMLGLKADDLKNVGKIPFPLAGTALLLEVSVAKRPLDKAVVAALRLLGQTLIAEGSLLAVLGTVFGALAAVATGATGGAAGAALVAALGVGAASLVSAAAGLGIASGVGIVVGGILIGITEGKLPNRSAYGQTMKLAAQAAGEKAPTEAEIDKAYNELSAAIESGNKVLAASSITARADWLKQVDKIEKDLKKTPGFEKLSAKELRAVAIGVTEKRFGKQPKEVKIKAAAKQETVTPKERKPVFDRQDATPLGASGPPIGLVLGGLGAVGAVAWFATRKK